MSCSPCGACKFLRRKCVRGCIFATYFSHEQGASVFSAIHKVFGASNVSKLLSHLPDSERSEAAVTISYEAQARLQDPIYGCVSHIFALQQEVMTLQAQLASLKQQAALQSLDQLNEASFAKIRPLSSTTSSSSYPKNLHSWLQSEYPGMVMPQFEGNSPNPGLETMLFGVESGQTGSFGSYEGSMESQDHLCERNDLFSHQWSTYHDMAPCDDLNSVAFGYSQNS